MAKYRNPPNYTIAIAVVHGRSEEQIVKHIKSQLRLNIYIHKRPTSIQINGVLHELQTNFRDVRALDCHPRIELPIHKGKIETEDFKIFTIMDTDDCKDSTKAQYINRSLFDAYLLKDRLVPIYNDSDLEHVLYQGHIIPKIYKEKEKIENYSKIFPVSPTSLSSSKMQDMKNVSNILRRIHNTNMELFIDYCIEQAEKRKIS